MEALKLPALIWSGDPAASAPIPAAQLQAAVVVVGQEQTAGANVDAHTPFALSVQALDARGCGTHAVVSRSAHAQACRAALLTVAASQFFTAHWCGRATSCMGFGIRALHVRAQGSDRSTMRQFFFSLARCGRSRDIEPGRAHVSCRLAVMAHRVPIRSSNNQLRRRGARAAKLDPGAPRSGKFPPSARLQADRGIRLRPVRAPFRW
jgi:hypothetical protein